ncbi:hypothetical protein U3516DRAFT_825438 [Neocallimastix sp. 'constans']
MLGPSAEESEIIATEHLHYLERLAKFSLDLNMYNIPIVQETFHKLVSITGTRRFLQRAEAFERFLTMLSRRTLNSNYYMNRQYNEDINSFNTNINMYGYTNYDFEFNLSNPISDFRPVTSSNTSSSNNTINNTNTNTNIISNNNNSNNNNINTNNTNTDNNQTNDNVKINNLNKEELKFSNTTFKNKSMKLYDLNILTPPITDDDDDDIHLKDEQKNENQETYESSPSYSTITISSQNYDTYLLRRKRKYECQTTTINYSQQKKIKH